jgi:hypothetical protein
VNASAQRWRESRRDRVMKLDARVPESGFPVRIERDEEQQRYGRYVRIDSHSDRLALDANISAGQDTNGETWRLST